MVVVQWKKASIHASVAHFCTFLFYNPCIPHSPCLNEFKVRGDRGCGVGGSPLGFGTDAKPTDPPPNPLCGCATCVCVCFCACYMTCVCVVDACMFMHVNACACVSRSTLSPFSLSLTRTNTQHPASIMRAECASVTVVSPLQHSRCTNIHCLKCNTHHA